MADESAILEYLEPEQMRVLRERARGCSVGALWREIVARALTQLEAEEDGAFVNPKTGVVYRPPANPKSIMDLAGMISDPYVRAEDPLDQIVGMIEGDGEVTGENFHDYLYGKDRED